MRALRHPAVRTIGMVVLLFCVGLFISDRIIDAFGRHWWIAPFRFGPLAAYFAYLLQRRQAPS